MWEWIDDHTARIALALVTACAVIALLFAYVHRGEQIASLKSQLHSPGVRRAVRLAASPCAADAASDTCAELRIRITREEPTRIACITVRQAGYPCLTKRRGK